MSRWTCPACDREFAREGQSHICVPGCTVEECFAPWPPTWREIYDLLIDHHFLKLTGVNDVDAQVRDWLTDAYDAGLEDQPSLYTT